MGDGRLAYASRAGAEGRGQMVAPLLTESWCSRAYGRVEIVPEIVGVFDTDAEAEEGRRQVSLSRDRSPSFHR